MTTKQPKPDTEEDIKKTPGLAALIEKIKQIAEKGK